MNLYSQEKDEPILYPATSLTDLVKFSSAKIVNNLPYNGTAYGFKNGKGTFIIDYEALDTFTVNTKDYDSLQFYSEYLRDGKQKVLDGFFLTVKENAPFTYMPIPVKDLVGLDIETNSVKKLKGKKLYEIILSDDADLNNIDVIALPESAPYIYIDRVDSTIISVSLRNTSAFASEVSKSVQDRILKGEEVIMPIGIKMFDKEIPSHFEEYRIFLKKIKKVKKK